jgi:hypothetical protein
MEYRAFSLDDNGHVFASEVIVAETDEEAMLGASAFLDQPFELLPENGILPSAKTSPVQ